MNSKKLIEQFPHVYQEFFGKNNLVVSMPFLINRCDDIMPDYSGISIKQKIPLRIYAGVSKNNLGKIRFNNITYRDSIDNDFIKADLMQYAPYFYNLTQIINRKFEHIVHKSGGFDINFISEISRGKGLGIDALISMLITVLLHRLEGDFHHKDISKLNELSLNEVIDNNYLPLKKIFKDSFEIDLEIHGRTFYTSKVSSFFDSHYPIISFTENNLHNAQNQTNFESFKRFGFRFDEIFEGLREIPYMPIDYGIIYSGKPVFLEQILQKNQTNIAIYDGIRQKFKSIFKRYCDDLLPIKKPRFFTNFLEGNDAEISQTYGNIMGIVSMETIYFLRKLFSQGYNDNDMKNFIKSLDKIRYSNYLTRENSESLIAFVNKFLGNLETNKNLISIFPNDTSIMGGSVCVVMPSEGFRKILLDALNQTKKDFVGVDLFYTNWLDGTEYSGLKFEQDVDQNIFSRFINSSSYAVKKLNGSTTFGSYEECISKNDNDLLLDCVNNKIFMNGRKLTSDDLNSQTATIELLKMLMENIGKEINNKSLSISSYSKNKNEMIGKIVLPLLELAKKELNKDFPLVCKGSIYDFYVKLNPSNISIAILDKI